MMINGMLTVLRVKKTPVPLCLCTISHDYTYTRLAERHGLRFRTGDPEAHASHVSEHLTMPSIMDKHYPCQSSRHTMVDPHILSSSCIVLYNSTCTVHYGVAVSSQHTHAATCSEQEKDPPPLPQPAASYCM